MTLYFHSAMTQNITIVGRGIVSWGDIYTTTIMKHKN